MVLELNERGMGSQSLLLFVIVVLVGIASEHNGT